jgi:outer membrane receptor protein involved in Fe transport
MSIPFTSTAPTLPRPPIVKQPDAQARTGVDGGWGLGWRPTEATHLSLTGFYSRIDNLIQLTLAPTLGLFVSVNIPHARIQGVEMEGMHDFGRGLRPSMRVYGLSFSERQCLEH